VHARLKVDPSRAWHYHILRILALWWFCCKSTPLLVMNLKPSMKVVTRLKTPPFLHDLQFLALDIIVDCTIRFIDCLLIPKRIT
jgi:hypothetical protein